MMKLRNGLTQESNHFFALYRWNKKKFALYSAILYLAQNTCVDFIAHNLANFVWIFFSFLFFLAPQILVLVYDWRKKKEKDPKPHDDDDDDDDDVESKFVIKES